MRWSPPLHEKLIKCIDAWNSSLFSICTILSSFIPTVVETVFLLPLKPRILTLFSPCIRTTFNPSHTLPSSYVSNLSLPSDPLRLTHKYAELSPDRTCPLTMILYPYKLFEKNVCTYCFHSLTTTHSSSQQPGIYLYHKDFTETVPQRMINQLLVVLSLLQSNYFLHLSLLTALFLTLLGLHLMTSTENLLYDKNWG